MAIRMDMEQLKALLERWIRLQLMLKDVLDLGHDCARETENTGLPDVIGMTMRISNHFNDLYDMYCRVEEMCDYLQKAIALLQEAEGPADSELLSQAGSTRKCPVCGFRQDASLPYCFNCAKPMDAASSAKPASDDWDDDPWGDDIPVSDGPDISLTIDRSMSFAGGSGEFDAAPQPDDDWNTWDDGPELSSGPSWLNDIDGQFSAPPHYPQQASAGSVDQVRVTPMSLSERILDTFLDDFSVEDAVKAERPKVRMSRIRKTHSMPPLAHRSDLSRLMDQTENSTYSPSSGPRICSMCGREVPAYSRFCQFCGALLPEETPEPPNLSQVQFSAVAPRRFERGKYSTMDIFMYEDGWRHIIDRHIRAMEQDAQETGSGYRKVAKGARIRILLSSPDVTIPDGDQSAPWIGRYLQFTFAVAVPKNFREKQFLLQAAVFVDDVPLTRLTWTMDRDSAAHKLGLWSRKRHEAQTPETIRSDIRSAFISYSSADLERVTPIIQGIRAVRPDMDIFFDVDSLHSGEKWRRTLEKEISERDVLFLCWSQSAKASEWVDYEWRFALEHKGLDAIQPVPLELPTVCPPPKELHDLHFNDKLLYFRKFINANT